LSVAAPRQSHSPKPLLDPIPHVVQPSLLLPSPKLVCIDFQPYTTTQAPERSDILNVGGFSDAVFSVVAAFLADDGGRFVAEVEKVEL
jgi:60 kDa SS-A/Ro ribonucleoprotein